MVDTEKPLGMSIRIANAAITDVHIGGQIDILVYLGGPFLGGPGGPGGPGVFFLGAFVTGDFSGVLVTGGFSGALVTGGFSGDLVTGGFPGAEVFLTGAGVFFSGAGVFSSACGALVGFFVGSLVASGAFVGLLVGAAVFSSSGAGVFSDAQHSGFFLHWLLSLLHFDAAHFCGNPDDDFAMPSCCAWSQPRMYLCAYGYWQLVAWLCSYNDGILTSEVLQCARCISHGGAKL